MIKAALVLVLAVVAVALVPVASASEGMEEENAAQTARALSLQALAILERGLGHEEATEKLDLALAAGDQGGVDLQALRAAHSALHEEDAATAERLLQDAFLGESSHLVGVTFRPAIGWAQTAAAIAGGIVLALAALGLARRHRVERRAA